MKVTVRLFSGRDIEVEVELTDTIEEVLHKAQAIGGKAFESELLVYNKILDMKLTVADYEIPEGALLRIAKRFRG
jgi:hypothetical protein